MSKRILKPIKKLLSLFPPTMPFRVYNILLKIPFLKYPINLTIRLLTPDYLDIQEGRVIFDKEDPVMAGALTLGEYEPGTMAIFRDYLKAGMTVVDIGANIGYFTIIAAKRVGPSGKVFSYEPDPHNFKLLLKNIETNKFDNVITYPIALSDKAGTRELFFGDNQTTLSFSDKKGTGRSESVTTDTLDSSLQISGYKQIDLIKMDIEGAEPIALEGMKETIAANPNIIILFEFHPNAIIRLGLSPLKFLERISELGFLISAIDENLKNHSSISDLEAFAKSFFGKEKSQNLIALKK